MTFAVFTLSILLGTAAVDEPKVELRWPKGTPAQGCDPVQLAGPPGGVDEGTWACEVSEFGELGA
jgi:hypothetical protein